LKANVLLARQIGSARAACQDIPAQERNSAIAHYRTVAGRKRHASMDILAAMFVYLASVTGIIAALAISFFLVFLPPHQATPQGQMKQSVALVVEQTTPRLPPLVQHANAGTEQQATPAVPGVAQSVPAPQQTAAAASPLQVQAMRAQYLRRIAQEERARRWAYQQDPSFENRFLGYAD
jgi:hypothetical protein